MALPAPRRRTGNATSKTFASGWQRNAADRTVAWKRGLRDGGAARTSLSAGWTARANCRRTHHFARSRLRLGARVLPLGPLSLRVGTRDMATPPARACRLGAGALGARSTRLVCDRRSLEVNPK